VEARVRALVGNPLQATPWLPAYHDELNYTTPRREPIPENTVKFRPVGRGTLTADLVGKPAEVRPGIFTAVGNLAATAAVATPRFTDTFNRADSTLGLGPNYVIHDGVAGIQNNAAYPTVTTTWCYATLATPAATNDLEAAIVLGPVLGAQDHVLVLAGVSATGEGIFAYFYTQTASWFVQNSWSNYSGIQLSIPFAYANGDELKLRRVGLTYTIFKNGVDTGLSYLHSSGTADVNHRLVGFGCYAASPGVYRTVDAFSAYPMP
jgi:hypothetical protein